MKNLEIERKFSLAGVDIDEVKSLLIKLGFNFIETITITDYFLEPFDSFDLVRLRNQCGQDKIFFLTLKSWIKSGPNSKERLELEEVLSPNVARVLTQLVLGDSNVLRYTKTRDVFTNVLSQKTVTVCFDNVLDLGRYSGNYLEIEILAESVDDIDSATAIIHKLALDLLSDKLQAVELSFSEMLKRAR